MLLLAAAHVECMCCARASVLRLAYQVVQDDAPRSTILLEMLRRTCLTMLEAGSFPHVTEDELSLHTVAHDGTPLLLPHTLAVY